MPSATINQVEVVNTSQPITSAKRKSLTGLLGAPWSSAMLTLAPTAWWRLGSSYTLDSSGNSHTITSYQPTGFSSVAGLLPSYDSNGALDLNGSTGFLTDQNTTAPNSSTISVVAIVQMTAAPTTTDRRIVDREYTPSAGFTHFSLAVTTAGKARWRYYNTSNTAFTATGTTNICDGNPHLIVATYSNATKILSLYVDSITAEATATLTGTSRSSISSIPVTLGCEALSLAGGTFYDGVLDEPAYWAGTALTTTQIGTLLNAYQGAIAEQDSAQRIAYTRFFAVGQASETNTAQPITPAKGHTLETIQEDDLAQALTIVRPLNGTFESRDDISADQGSLPTTNLLLANTSAGEYTNGLVATVWWEWTTPGTVPYSVTWSFTYAGQSGSGGAALRLYEPGTLDVIPPSGDIIEQDTAAGASGTVSVTLTPVADTTYYLQQGIEEKVGTQGHLTMTILWEAPPAAFTPVIP